jgi:hypothetical protein
MKFLGWIALFLIIQLVFLVGFLKLTGRWPQDELRLAGEYIWRGGPEPPKKVVEPKPPEAPSIDVQLDRRIRETRELERREAEIKALRGMVDGLQQSAAAEYDRLRALKKQLEGQVESDAEKLASDGRKRLVGLLEASPPKNVKSLLLDLKDEDEVLRILKELEPERAAKVFKEFKLPAEQEKLNGWLSKLGRGEPEASAKRKIGEALDRKPSAKKKA